MSSWVSALHVTHFGGAGKVFSSIEASSLDTIIIQNESLGLTIDRETATAHWHGERIDYDHALKALMALKALIGADSADSAIALIATIALMATIATMATMASWDSGDTRPEAGPAAGDWNPS